MEEPRSPKNMLYPDFTKPFQFFVLSGPFLKNFKIICTIQANLQFILITILLLQEWSTAKINATEMRWFSGLVDFNFKVKYSPGESSQDYDYIL